MSDRFHLPPTGKPRTHTHCCENSPYIFQTKNLTRVDQRKRDKCEMKGAELPEGQFMPKCQSFQIHLSIGKQACSLSLVFCIFLTHNSMDSNAEHQHKTWKMFTGLYLRIMSSPLLSWSPPPPPDPQCSSCLCETYCLRMAIKQTKKHHVRDRHFLQTLLIMTNLRDTSAKKTPSFLPECK